ncbi:MAG: porin [Pseudomonadota bacterium]
MKLVRKAVLATAVAAAMAPMAASADATVYGEFDVSFGLEMAEESAFAVEGSPAGDNRLGIRGAIDTYNGNEVTYQGEVSISPESQNSVLANNYHTYIGYRTDSYEVRGGTQHLPLRLTMEKTDLFQGTYADQNNAVVLPNTIATDSVMFLSSNDNMRWAVSLDWAAANGESANDPDAQDNMRIGGMVDFKLSEGNTVAVGLENLKDSYTALGITGSFDLGGGVGVTAGYSSVDIDGGNTPTTLTGGGYMAMGDDARVKAQIGMLDPDVNGADDPTYFAVGYDKRLADTVTGYLLFATGMDSGLAGGAQAAGVATPGAVTPPNYPLETDNDGDSSVLAAGLKMSF